MISPYDLRQTKINTIIHAASKGKSKEGSEEWSEGAKFARVDKAFMDFSSEFWPKKMEWLATLFVNEDSRKNLVELLMGFQNVDQVGWVLLWGFHYF